MFAGHFFADALLPLPPDAAKYEAGKVMSKLISRRAWGGGGSGNRGGALGIFGHISSDNKGTCRHRCRRGRRYRMPTKKAPPECQGLVGF
jgi:hypothetical protein